MNFKKIILIFFATFSIRAMNEQIKNAQNKVNQQFYDAIRGGSIEESRQALLKGANINKVLIKSLFSNQLVTFQPIREAYRYDLFKLLLECNADANETYDNRPTILWEKVSSGEYDKAELLIKHGADVNYAYDKRSILLECLLTEYASNDKLQFIKLLLESGSDVNYSINSDSELIKTSALDMALINLICVKAVMNKKIYDVDDLIKKIDGGQLYCLRKVSALVDKVNKGNVDPLEEPRKIISSLIQYGAPLLQIDLDHEFLKPMLLPYVDVVQANTSFPVPLVRLVVEYIYNIKVKLES